MMWLVKALGMVSMLLAFGTALYVVGFALIKGVEVKFNVVGVSLAIVIMMVSSLLAGGLLTASDLGLRKDVDSLIVEKAEEQSVTNKTVTFKDEQYYRVDDLSADIIDTENEGKFIVFNDEEQVKLPGIFNLLVEFDGERYVKAPIK